MVIGITAYGHCIALTRGYDRPRISIASTLFRDGTVAVSATILHEMIHAKLVLEGKDSAHNGQPWCDEITRLSPSVLGRAIHAKPVRPRRVDGKPKRVVEPGHLSRKELARWPHHAHENLTGGAVIPVDTY